MSFTTRPSVAGFGGAVCAGHYLAAQIGAAELASGGNAADACQASCVDWYGNARPIFIGDRLFGLLGYELVEGTRQGGNVREVGRTSFAPGGQGGRP